MHHHLQMLMFKPVFYPWHRPITLKGNDRGVTPMAFNATLSQGDATPIPTPSPSGQPVFYAQ